MKTIKVYVEGGVVTEVTIPKEFHNKLQSKKKERYERERENKREKIKRERERTKERERGKERYLESNTLIGADIGEFH